MNKFIDWIIDACFGSEEIAFLLVLFTFIIMLWTVFLMFWLW